MRQRLGFMGKWLTCFTLTFGRDISPTGYRSGVGDTRPFGLFSTWQMPAFLLEWDWFWHSKTGFFQMKKATTAPSLLRPRKNFPRSRTKITCQHNYYFSQEDPSSDGSSFLLIQKNHGISKIWMGFFVLFLFVYLTNKPCTRLALKLCLLSTIY